MPRVPAGMRYIAEFMHVAAQDGRHPYVVVRNQQQLDAVERLGVKVHYRLHVSAGADDDPLLIRNDDAFFQALAQSLPAADTARDALLQGDIEQGHDLPTVARDSALRIQMLYQVYRRGLTDANRKRYQLSLPYVLVRSFKSLAFLLTEGHAKTWAFLILASRLNPTWVFSKAIWAGVILPLTITNTYNIYAYVACRSEPRSNWDYVYVQRQMQQHCGYYYDPQEQVLCRGQVSYPELNVPMLARGCYSAFWLTVLAIANHITEMVDSAAIGIGTLYDPAKDGLFKFWSLLLAGMVLGFFLKATPNTRIVNNASHENRSYETMLRHRQLVPPLADRCSVVAYQRQRIAVAAAVYIPWFYLGLHAYATSQNEWLHHAGKAAAILMLPIILCQAIGTIARATAYEVAQVGISAGVVQPQRMDRALANRQVVVSDNPLTQRRATHFMRWAQLTPLYRRMAHAMSPRSFMLTLVSTHYLAMVALSSMATMVANNEVVCNLINMANDPDYVAQHGNVKDACGLTASWWTSSVKFMPDWVTMDKLVLLGISLCAGAAIAGAGINYVYQYQRILQQPEDDVLAESRQDTSVSVLP